MTAFPAPDPNTTVVTPDSPPIPVTDLERENGRLGWENNRLRNTIFRQNIMSMLLVIAFILATIVMAFMKSDFRSTRTKAIATCKYDLEELRKYDFPAKQQLDMLSEIEYKVKTYKLSMKDIGSTKSELEKLTRKAHIKSAKEQLEALRKGDPNYRSTVRALLDGLRHHNLTLEDAGSSKKELEELMILGAKTKALEMLAILREGIIATPATWATFTSELQAAKLKPADIGVNDIEYKKLEASLKRD